MKTALCLSATPGPYELERTGGEVVEQVIRPTGLVDPIIFIKPARGQVRDLEDEVRKRAEKQERTLRPCSRHYGRGPDHVLSRRRFALASGCTLETDAIEPHRNPPRSREGQFDVLVGVNLLREGLDLPEVSLVAILDADKEGFLRSRSR